MNRQQRRAAQARGEDFPPGYVEQIEAMAKTISGWMASHPKAAPIYFMPPPEALVIVDLPSILDRVARNAEARELANVLIESVAFNKAPSLFMLRVALQQARCPVQHVPLSVFLDGYEPMPTNRGGDA